MARISCSDWGYRKWILAEVIPSMAKIGYRGIEIVTHHLEWPIGYHLNPEPYIDEKYVEMLMETLENNKMQVVSISPANNFYKPITGSIKEEVKHVEKHIDLAVIVKSPIVRIQAGGSINMDVHREALIEMLTDPIAECTDYARSRGVQITIETHGGAWVAIPENMKDLLDSVRSDYLGVCLHTLPEYAEDTVRMLGPKIMHLHLSDSSKIAQKARMIERLKHERLAGSEIMTKLGVTRKQIKEAEHQKVVYLGEGEIDFRSIFKGLKDSGYSGWWNFEGSMTIDPEGEARRAFVYINKLLKEMGIQ